MKNKTIIIGLAGSGKSYLAIEKALNNKGTTIIANGCCEKNIYEEDFPKLNLFEEKDGKDDFQVEKDGKYYILNIKSSSTIGVVDALAFGCDYENLQNDKDAMIVFDDGSWQTEENKLLTFQKLSHIKSNVIIVVDDLSEILDDSNSELTNEIKEDIKNYWNIIRCYKSKVNYLSEVENCLH